MTNGSERRRPKIKGEGTPVEDMNIAEYYSGDPGRDIVKQIERTEDQEMKAKIVKDTFLFTSAALSLISSGIYALSYASQTEIAASILNPEFLNNVRTWAQDQETLSKAITLSSVGLLGLSAAYEKYCSNTKRQLEDKLPEVRKFVHTVLPKRAKGINKGDPRRN